MAFHLPALPAVDCSLLQLRHLSTGLQHWYLYSRVKEHFEYLVLLTAAEGLLAEQLLVQNVLLEGTNLAAAAAVARYNSKHPVIFKSLETLLNVSVQ